MKSGENKWVNANFTSKKVENISISMNGKQVPHANKASYLGVKLYWKVNVKKREEKERREGKKWEEMRIYQITGRSSALELLNNFPLRKQILKPTRTCGI